jgi:proteasomal ATPase-associated factor 1
MTTTTQSANAPANSGQNVFILPQITVQHDLSHVIDDVHDGVASNGWEDVWVSCYLEGRPSIHGKLRIARSNDGVSFEARDGIQWQGTSAVGTPAQCNITNLH